MEDEGQFGTKIHSLSDKEPSESKKTDLQTRQANSHKKCAAKKSLVIWLSQFGLQIYLSFYCKKHFCCKKTSRSLRRDDGSCQSSWMWGRGRKMAKLEFQVMPVYTRSDSKKNLNFFSISPKSQFPINSNFGLKSFHTSTYIISNCLFFKNGVKPYRISL